MNKCMSIPPDLMAGSGLHVSGGWHAFAPGADHGYPEREKVLVLPAEGDYSHLGNLGFATLPAPAAVASMATADAQAEASPLARRTRAG